MKSGLNITANDGQTKVHFITFLICICRSRGQYIQQRVFNVLKRNRLSRLCCFFLSSHPGRQQLYRRHTGRLRKLHISICCCFRTKNRFLFLARIYRISSLPLVFHPLILIASTILVTTCSDSLGAFTSSLTFMLHCFIRSLVPFFEF